MEKYVHSAPTTSPFYDNYLSPFCQFLCENFVPEFVHPDHLTLIGLLCASLAVYCSSLESPFMIISTALLWIVYSLCDNMDGKQARRLKLSSPGGDFLDHTIDSAVTTLSALIWMNSLFPIDWLIEYRPLMAFIAGQWPFYIGTYAHLIIGRTLLGGVVDGADYFTVDEYNILYLPGITLLRLIDLWRHKIYLFETSVSLGVLLGAVMLTVSLCVVIKVMYQIVEQRHLRIIWPGMAFGMLVSFFQINILTGMPFFALINAEIIARRLKLRPTSASVGWIWYPLIPLVPFAKFFPLPSHAFLHIFLFFFVFCWVFSFQATINTNFKIKAEKRTIKD
eukprot:GHVL01026464.1.p1 GENE.GHVL01026464.1~~GHVL01026464.1.p1  ORF type:complete len:336 (-),score=31.31 GHVL01026464.1:285-1292(-)